VANQVALRELDSLRSAAAATAGSAPFRSIAARTSYKRERPYTPRERNEVDRYLAYQRQVELFR